MIKNYLKTAIVHLIKNKTYSLISILSLAIGLAVCILLLLYVQNELSYDRFNKNADNIYRLCNPENPCHAPLAAKLFADNIPEIKDYTRILPRDNEIVEYKEKRFKENKVAYVDPSLFRIFSLNFKQGEPEKALQQPFTIVISEKTAHKYFGSEDPIGKILKLNNESNYTITGVIEDMPYNSHFRYEIFITLAGTEKEDGMSNWGWQNFMVYFLFQDQFSIPDVETKCSQLMKDHIDTNSPLPIYSIQNLKDIHLYSSHILYDIQPQNSITYVLIFLAIGILILLIACFNYINLLTANATTRVIEIAMRKAFGASRNQLAMQYITESLVVLFISFCISLLIIGFSLPVFNELSGKNLSFLMLTNIFTISGILGTLLIIGILAGWYPAFILSSYNPIKVLKSSKISGESKFQVKKNLVGAQFIIVITLIACAIIMFRQISYLKNTELGFDKEFVLSSEVGSLGNEEKYLTLKRTLLDQNFVVNVSAASRVPSWSITNIGGVLPQGQTKIMEMPYVHVHFDYFKTLGIKPLKGRLFSNEFKTDTSESIILNEAAVKYLSIKGDPIGQIMKCNWPKSNRKIIGVVKDFHFESLYEKIKPMVFVIDYDECWQLLVKVRSSDASNSISSLNKICQTIYPDQVFDFSSLDEKFEILYKKDKDTFSLMGLFAILAIILAIMGLFGMASFIITSRTKEIGIRKVNGALVSEILFMLNKGFMKWIAFAFVISTPISYYITSRWLEKFPYRISQNWWVYALAGIIVMVIVIITVSIQSWRAATRTPIETLRYE